MGFLRFYLALCVLESHSGNVLSWPVPRGRDAVQIFFIISGFYMGMILTERYGSSVAFYKSRWLRIAVPYYLHLVVIALASLAAGLLFSQWLSLSGFFSGELRENGWLGIVFAGVTNITLIGQDFLLFLRDNRDSGLRLTANFTEHPFPLYRYLVIPQCWSVAVEMTFYLISPLLNRLTTRSLGLIVLATLGLRFAACANGLDHDPWNYRFAPFELVFFVLGILSWRFFRVLRDRFSLSLRLHGYVCLCLGIVACGWAFRWLVWRLGLEFGEPLASVVLVCLWAVPVPWIFLATKNRGFDRNLGELSFPIYLNHLFVIYTIRALPLPQTMAPHAGTLTVFISAGFAVGFWWFFLRGFEEKRHLKYVPACN